MIGKVVSRDLFVPSPGPGIGVWGSTWYTEPTGTRLMGMHSQLSRSDTIDVAYVRYSEDNGRTWGPTAEKPTKFTHPDGTGRRHFRGGYVDPKTGRFLFLFVEGILPTDHPLEGMKHWQMQHWISKDGGRTVSFEGPIVHEDPSCNPSHPFPDVWAGKNCVMMGDLGMRPLTRDDGIILVPVQSSSIGPDGKWFNPTGAMTYLDSMVLMGRWTEEGRLAWRCSERIKPDPARTTRGLFEPTLAILDDGRILIVMRGSNDIRPSLPGYRWFSLSDDGGETWSEAQPWTYTDHTPFFSPSSCSQLLAYSDGRLFWFGNISPTNPQGNAPRYPLVMAEVDRHSGLLRRDSVTVLDDRQPDENAQIFLSNFLVREERGTGRLILHLTRLFAKSFQKGNEYDWTADSLVYGIEVA